jgi:non-ribosomal peptide synthase protein (TIGR01720 family)
LEINGHVADGRLEVAWTFSEAVFRRATIERVANDFKEALGELMRHCTNEGSGGFTVSDFPLAGLDAKKLDKVLSRFMRKN